MFPAATTTETVVPAMDPSRIKDLRVALGMTREEFADALGLKLRAIFYWEAGEPGRGPTGPALILLHMLERHPRRIKEIQELAALAKAEEEEPDEKKGRRR